MLACAMSFIEGTETPIIQHMNSVEEISLHMVGITTQSLSVASTRVYE